MKSVVTSHGTYVTGDELANAVALYGLALAKAHEVDWIAFPAVDADGTVERVEMRIGWLVDFAVISRTDGRAEFTDAATSDDLLLRARTLDERRQWLAEPPAPSWLAWEHFL